MVASVTSDYPARPSSDDRKCDGGVSGYDVIALDAAPADTYLTFARLDRGTALNLNPERVDRIRNFEILDLFTPFFFKFTFLIVLYSL